MCWPPVAVPHTAAEVEEGETELARRARRRAQHVPLTARRSPQAQLAPAKLVSSPAPGLRARAGGALEYSDSAGDFGVAFEVGPGHA